MTLSNASIAASRPTRDDGAPSVVLLAGSGDPGHAFAWCAAMRRLLAAGQPFVVVDDGDHTVESPADRQARRCWIRAHARELQARCLGLVAIEREVERRSQTRLALGALVEPLSVRVLVVSTEALARQLAGVLLMGARPVATTPCGDGNPARRDTGPSRLRSIR
ncbi:hypothetical protein OVY01_04050 [Robbsia sp. Bb-Pol-6]|uniref:Uncharacterized protein n=1 Tax=Robbsia betulipollinis TaxID=2981849 RepID=A0ABT3ZIT1_9BURK|nr:hypothetical protein [Robbsia betulipollinis]MCY0386425.1 hypothetical protein [Robbsia betulipollinis]